MSQHQVEDDPRAQATLRESRRFLRATLDALPDPVAVLNEAGIVLGVNRSWEMSAAAGEQPLTACGPGTSYLAVCAGAAETAVVAARSVATAIREILGGKRTSFATEYSILRRDRREWFAVRLRRFPDGGPVRLVVVHEEISDRKRTEETLRQSETRTRSILEAAVDAIITCDERGIIDSVNPSAETMFGYSAAEMVGKSLGALMPSPYREEHGRYLARYLETGKKRIIGIGREVVGVKKDGTVFPIDLAVSEVVLDGRRLFTGTVRDITDRKHLEEELAARARCQETLAHLGVRALAGLELDALLEEVVNAVAETLEVENTAVLELERDGGDLLLRAGVGWKPGRVGSVRLETDPEFHTGFTLLAPEPVVLEDSSSETRFAASPLLTEHGIVSGVSLLIPGSKHPFGVLSAHTSRRRSFSRDEVGFLQSVANVLALAVRRHEAEAALSESDRRFRAIFDQSYQGIGLLKPDGTVLEANQAMVDLSGLTREQLIGRPFWQGRWWSQASGDKRLEDAVGEAAAGSFVRWEVEMPAADGGRATLDISIKPVADGAGRVVLLIPEARDITEHRRLEAQLLQAQKMEAVGQLAGGVAHDFNTLLGSIAGYGEMLLERAQDHAQVRRPAEQILKSAQRGANLTRQLLAFSRRQVLQPRVLNLNSVIAEMEDMLRPLIGEEIELELDLNPSLPWVRVDGGQFEQVIMNLIVNSVDAMPDGGTITVETETCGGEECGGRCERSTAPTECVVLSVRDTGVGMDETTRSHLFEPFFTTKEPGKGTGLGLATVYGIVRQSGGSITVESEPEKGATFSIFLPSAVQPEESEATPVRPAEAGRGSECVLLVEDDEMLRGLLCEVLDGKGYTVLSAGEPAAALELSDQHPGDIHLLVSDMVMPGMSGVELARRLGTSRQGLRVILMSGYTGEDFEQRKDFDPGAVFLQKPFSTKDFARIVRTLLDAGE